MMDDKGNCVSTREIEDTHTGCAQGILDGQLLLGEDFLTTGFRLYDFEEAQKDSSVKTTYNTVTNSSANASKRLNEQSIAIGYEDGWVVYDSDYTAKIGHDTDEYMTLDVIYDEGNYYVLTKEGRSTKGVLDPVYAVFVYDSDYRLVKEYELEDACNVLVKLGQGFMTMSEFSAEGNEALCRGKSDNTSYAQVIYDKEFHKIGVIGDTVTDWFIDGTTVYTFCNEQTQNSNEYALTERKYDCSSLDLKGETYEDSRVLVDQPTADVESGTTLYKNNLGSIALSCATEGASIYYTVNGEIPNRYGKKYETPIVLADDMVDEQSQIVVKAYAVKKGCRSSDVASFTYKVEETKPVMYTVTFDSNGGSEVASAEVRENTAVNKPEDPVYDGYLFQGWYLNGKEYDFAVPVTRSFTLKAEWEMDADKNAGDVLEQDIPEGGISAIPKKLWIAGIEKDGYEYTGKTVMPKVRVYDYKTLLTEKTDYTISYKNNIKAAETSAETAPIIVIKGKGNYTSSVQEKFRIVPREITADGITVEAQDIKMGKIGSVIKPKVTVKDGSKTLAEGKDYEIIFEKTFENELAGQPLTLTVKGKGNYQKETKAVFHIYQQSVAGFVIDPVETQTYSGNAVEPEVTVYASRADQKRKNALVQGEHYSVSYSANDRVGAAKVLIHGEGSYGGIKTFTFQIAAKSLDGAENAGIGVVLQEESFVYTGTAIKPQVTVNFGEKVLTEGKDYSVTYQNNVNVSTENVPDKKKPRVVVKGKGSYAGTVMKYFQITPRMLTEENDINVTVQDVKVKKSDVVVKPKVTVKDGKKSLKEGKDYTVDYGTWTLGTAERMEGNPYVRITGKEGSNYACVQDGEGVITKNFHIYSAAESIKECAVILSYGEDDVQAETLEKGDVQQLSVEYTGMSIKPQVAVMDGDELLTVGKDYTVSYKNNVNVPKNTKASAQPQVIIKGKGRFEGKRTEYFSIEPQDLEDVLELQISVKDMKYAGKEVRPAVTVKNGKKTLKAGKDYAVDYRNNVSLGEKETENAPTVTVTGKGNYKGSLKETFRIYEKDISQAVADKIASQTYSGEEKEPEVRLYASKKDQKTGIPIPENCYDVTYQKNVKVGKGEIVIIGQGVYGGTKKVSFVILPRWMQ